MYRVVDWDKHYENNRSRDVSELEWVPFKNRHDGDGITELLDHDNGMAHLGAWVLLVQVASKCGKPAGKCGPGDTPRGTLRRDNGKPHDARSIARVSGANLVLLEEAIPRFLDIGWLEVIPDPAETCTIPQAPAAPPHPPAVPPQEGDDRARGRVPFPSLPFQDGGPGEGAPPPRPPATSHQGPTQADLDRALEVLRLYPTKAAKDGRVIVKDLAAQGVLGARIAKHPDYPWEEHATLEALNPTPKNAHTWALAMPDPVSLENLRSARRPMAPARNRL